MNSADEMLAVEVVRRAGNFVGALLDDFPKSLTPDCDAACERELGALLMSERPQDSIYGEEGVRHDGVSGRTWVIDPIDGSDNVRLGVRVYGSACGLFDGDGTPIAGAIYSHATMSVVSYSGHDRGDGVTGVSTRSPARVGSVVQGRGLRGVRADAVLSLRRRLEQAHIRVLKTHAPTLDWTLLIHDRIDFVVFCDTSAEDTRVGVAAAEMMGVSVMTMSGRRWPAAATMSGVAVAPGREYVLEYLAGFEW